MSAPPTRQEWVEQIGRAWPIYQAAPGHHIVVGQEELVAARCTCGWGGPDRSGDPHMVGLVLDDVAWHCHVIGVRCPGHDPQTGRECLDCAARDRAIAADVAAARAEREPWWKR